MLDGTAKQVEVSQVHALTRATPPVGPDEALAAVV